jgi:hypothetical protein
VVIFVGVGFRSVMAQRPSMIFVAYINLLVPLLLALWVLYERKKNPKIKHTESVELS